MKISFPVIAREERPAIAALCIVPLIYLIVALAITLRMGVVEVDPDYAYLMTGLQILALHPPSYFDHPGTPLQVLIAAVLAVTWLLALPFHGAEGIVTAVLSRPQFYLNICNMVLTVAGVGAALCLGQRIRSVTERLVPAVAAQATILLFFPALISTFRVTPEPLLLVASLLFGALLAPVALRLASEAEEKRHAIGIGIMLGIMVAIKITAAPLALSIFFLRSWHGRKTLVIYSLLSVAVCTALVSFHYLQMAEWFFGVLSHRGAYDSGERGMPHLADIGRNLLALMAEVPEIFVLLVVCGVAAALFPALRRLMTVSTIIIALQIMMIAKQPTARYLLPVVGIMALAIAGLFSHLWSPASGPVRNARIVVAALLAVGVCYNVAAVHAWTRDVDQAYAESTQFLKQVQASGCAIVPYYPARLPVYALDFGNYYTNYYFRDELTRLFPNSVVFDFFSKNFRRAFGGNAITPAEVEENFSDAQCIYLVGHPLENFGLAGSYPEVARIRHAAKVGVPLAVYRFRATP